MHRRGVQPSLGPVPDSMCHIPLKLGLHHLVTLLLHDLLRLHGEGLGPIRDGHREGVEAVVLGEGTLVAGHPRQLEEQLIPLMVLDAVALRAVEVLLHEGLIDHEPVGLDDRFEGVADAAFLLDVVPRASERIYWVRVGPETARMRGRATKRLSLIESLRSDNEAGGSFPAQPFGTPGLGASYFVAPPQRLGTA